MKNLIALFIFLLPLFATAQKSHTVGPKESLFSIGRLYNVHPRELASFNNIPFETGLTIGQVLKIPSKTTQAPVKEATAAPAPSKKEAMVKQSAAPVKAKGNFPVYHTVAKKEGLYGISKKYNVSIADIKKWNNMEGDALNEGMNLIVGYSDKPSETIVAVKEEKKQPQPVKQAEPEEVVNVPVKEAAKPATVKAEPKMAGDFKGGFFKSLFTQQVKDNTSKEEQGIAGVFKSTSGWEDGKYYCLHNSAPAGSIIKITNNSNQKSVYAKVLDLIPDLQQNSKLIIRISNAAAAELGVTASEFNCSLQF
jgi:LysM repeat protein